VTEIAGRGRDPALGAGRLLAGSIESPERAILLALRLSTCWPNGRWVALVQPAGTALRLPENTIAFLFMPD